MQHTSPLSYKEAGVDIEAGNQLINSIKQIAARTARPEVLGGLGGFASLCELPSGYREPVLVSATDGVGTKLKLAMAMDKHDTIGIDLVAMCANDLIVCGGQPLFFLDYYATGKLSPAMAQAVIEGIGTGCEQAGAALTGGETAEMPGMYQGEDYDLAGFCVGVVEKSQILDGSKVRPGDQIIALPSSGPHSNGYSLIRRILEIHATPLTQPFGDKALGEVLLEPTRIYVKPVLDLLRSHPVHALAHITGGGLLENIPRVLPEGCRAVLDKTSWQIPEIFCWLAEQGRLDDSEMMRTFNCGVGMLAIVPADSAQAALIHLRNQGESPWLIGEINESDQAPDVTFRS